MALSDRMGLLPLGWQTVRLVTEYSAGKKRLLTPASPFQLTSMSNWKEYSQQQPMSSHSNQFASKPSRIAGLVDFSCFGLNLVQMKQRLFVCPRSCDHGADLSRRVASVGGNLWLLVTDLRWLILEGKVTF